MSKTQKTRIFQKKTFKVPFRLVIVCPIMHNILLAVRSNKQTYSHTSKRFGDRKKEGKNQCMVCLMVTVCCSNIHKKEPTNIISS